MISSFIKTFLGFFKKPSNACSPLPVQTEDYFHSIIDSLPLGIGVLDSKEYINFVNPAFKKYIDFEKNTPFPIPFLDCIPKDYRPSLQQWLRNPCTLPFEVSFQHATIAFYHAPLKLSSTHEKFIYGIDVTEQKKLELQFVQSQKMQAVGQLAGGIAHDFNNLLTAMIGFCDFLLLRHLPGDQSFTDIIQIKQNANRAANLVRQLLAFSRQQSLQPRVLDVAEILTELTVLLRRLIGANIELKIIHGRDIGMIKADQGQLEQVIINLVVNARDAMKNGGQLSIETSAYTIIQEEQKGEEVLPAGQYVLITVKDTGTGIPPDILRRIFEPFFSTKEIGSGTGLGLSTVYGIIKQTGGIITVQSTEGQGTEFSIYFPVCKEEMQQNILETVDHKKDLSGAETILLVEDEDAVRLFVVRALKNKGYTVFEASCGETALEILQNNPQIDLMITDVVMPKIEGPELMNRARIIKPQLKVIFISGYAEDAFRERLQTEAHIQFLSKPFTLKDLAIKVKDILE